MAKTDYQPSAGPPGPWCAPHDSCPHCGRIWSPTFLASPDFRGSACDVGECVCGACEVGDYCVRHDPSLE